MFTFRSLQAKLFITYSTVLIGFALTISIPMYFYFQKNITANIKANVEQVVHGFSDNLDLNFISFENISVQLYNNNIGQSGSPDLIENMDLLSQTEPASLTELLQAQKAFNNFLLLNTAIYKNINKISLITMKGRSFSIPETEIQAPIDVVDNHLFKEAAEALGAVVLVYPSHEAISGNNSTAAFSFIRQLNWNATPKGFLEVQIHKDKLLDLQKTLSLAESKVMILHGDQVVYSSISDSSSSDSSRAPIKSYRELTSKALAGSDFVHIPNQPSEFAVFQTSARTGYTILVTVPEAKLFASLKLFRNVTILSVLLLILFSIVVYYILARILTHPIKKLKQAIDSVKIDDQIFPIENKYRMDEISMLNRSFQKMDIRLKTSLEEIVQFRTLQLQSQFNTLQAQINPHFLFNMLGVITGLSDGGETSKVSDVSRKLSSFLRYSITTGSPITTVKEEMGFTADYLELMKSRYLHRLSYEFQIDERIHSVLLPKLTIQPLVENCIQHGLHDNERPLTILISGHLVDGMWEICVSDNGVGFDSNALEAIADRIDAFVDSLHNQNMEMSFGGMGLISTIARLRLLLREQFAYSIGNNTDFGAYIRLSGSMKKIE